MLEQFKKKHHLNHPPSLNPPAPPAEITYPPPPISVIAVGLNDGFQITHVFFWGDREVMKKGRHTY